MLLLGVGEGSAYISSSPLPSNKLSCVFDSTKRPFGQADLRAFHQIHVWANTKKKHFLIRLVIMFSLLGSFSIPKPNYMQVMFSSSSETHIRFCSISDAIDLWFHH